MAEGGGGDFSNDCICACIYAMRRFMEMVLLLLLLLQTGL